MSKQIVAFRNFGDARKSQLMLYREIIAVCSQIHTKHINTAVWAERGFLFKPELHLKTQSVPHSKHSPSWL